mgnify:CR=1 FL=1
MSRTTVIASSSAASSFIVAIAVEAILASLDTFDFAECKSLKDLEQTLVSLVAFTLVVVIVIATIAVDQITIMFQTGSKLEIGLLLANQILSIHLEVVIVIQVRLLVIKQAVMECQSLSH